MVGEAYAHAASECFGDLSKMALNERKRQGRAGIMRLVRSRDETP
jgi:hypothetical protein